MKIVSISGIALAIFIFAACSSSKKSVKNTSVVAPTKLNSINGVFAPGNDELMAAQARDKSANIETLNEGYALYTGACTKCHHANNIYKYSEERWKRIMDEMAPKAKLTTAQKDAVFQYVLAIKATQAH